MSNCCYHGTFLHFSLQGSHLNICYYHQDLHGMLYIVPYISCPIPTRILRSWVRLVRAYTCSSRTSTHTQPPANEFMNSQLLHRYIIYCSLHNLLNTDPNFTFSGSFSARIHLFVSDKHTHAATRKQIYQWLITTQVCLILFST
jgi:hypothetical protein